MKADKRILKYILFDSDFTYYYPIEIGEKIKLFVYNINTDMARFSYVEKEKFSEVTASLPKDQRRQLTSFEIEKRDAQIKEFENRPPRINFNERFLFYSKKIANRILKVVDYSKDVVTLRIFDNKKFVKDYTMSRIEFERLVNTGYVD